MVWRTPVPYHQDRFVPAPAEPTFAALTAVVNQRHKVTRVEHPQHFLSFNSSMSALSWGEYFTAQVAPVEGGCYVRIVGTGKVGGQLGQKKRTQKITDELFADLAASLHVAIQPPSA
jgi:hypothetical protein